MNIKFNLFPYGKSKALTLSYDDGQISDLRLVKIMDQYKIKGTFHLNSGNIDRPGFLTRNDIITNFINQEISAHTKTHPRLDRISNSMIIDEVLSDRIALEDIVKYPVRGMSYPYGVYDKGIEGIVNSLGIEYSRTVHGTNNFIIPKDFLEWHPTCHHNKISDLWEQFLERESKHEMLLFYLWGHSFEFNQNDNWDIIETFCSKAGNQDNIWYATNIEIYDYIKAVHDLKFSAINNMILNQSAIDVWLTINDEKVCIKAGTIYYI